MIRAKGQASQHDFSRIPDVRGARSKFNRSFNAKDTWNFDYITPVFVDEVLPGDTIELYARHFTRFSPQALKNPVMDRAYMNVDFFFVPNRQVWDNFQKFMGEQKNPGDSTDYLVPQVTTSGPDTFDVGSIADKFGIPTGPFTTGASVNALPFRGYNRIYNEFFRDQDLIDSIPQPTDDGPDDYSDNYALRKSAKIHDYFTSARPSPQKGPATTLPFEGDTPVKGLGVENGTFGSSGPVVRETGGTSTVTYTQAKLVNPASPNTSLFVKEDTIGNPGYPAIYTDMSEYNVTINGFRQAIAVQSLLELDQRAGTRYIEITQAHFNVSNPDYTLQRPEYLGGGTSEINSNPVAQTAPTEGTSALGSLAAYGTSSERGRGIGFVKSFTEHGWVIGLARARANITYQQGLNKKWFRRTKLDFFWPKLQEIGEDVVFTKELYWLNDPVNDEDPFGYQERNADLRYMPGEIRGQFRSTYAQSLDSWHYAEEFGSKPELNQTFIESSTPTGRIKAIEDSPDLITDWFFDYQHTRRMVTYAVPATLGRF